MIDGEKKYKSENKMSVAPETLVPLYSPGDLIRRCPNRADNSYCHFGIRGESPLPIFAVEHIIKNGPARPSIVRACTAQYEELCNGNPRNASALTDPKSIA